MLCYNCYKHTDFNKRLDLLTEILNLDDFMNKSIRTLSFRFEHSVANMTLLTIALLAPGTAAVSVSGYICNIGIVTLGNIGGGILFVEIPYYLISKKSKVFN